LALYGYLLENKEDRKMFLYLPFLPLGHKVQGHITPEGFDDITKNETSSVP